jgi:competence protein ComEC
MVMAAAIARIGAAANRPGLERNACLHQVCNGRLPMRAIDVAGVSFAMREVILGFIEAQRGRFFLLLPVAMGAAILVYFALPAEPPPWLGVAVVAAGGAALAAGWRHPVARFAGAVALAAALGFARAEWRTQQAAPLLIVPTGPTAVTGTVLDVQALPGSRRITLGAVALDGGRAGHRDIVLRLRPDDGATVTPGEGLSTYALLFPPERPAYPGGFTPERQDFFAGIGAEGVALGHARVTPPAHPGRFGQTIAGLRETIAATILNTLPVATGSVAVTLLTGDQQAIPADERQNFIAAGLAHILAVAGLHVGIVMGLAFGAVRWGLTRRESWALHLPVKSIASLSALAAGSGYAVLTGTHLPILRSLAMACLITLGVLYGRQAVSLRGLAIAALAIMLMTPEAVVGAGFQMSFSAVLALIAGYQALPPGWRHGGQGWRRIPAHIGALALTSLLAGGASMPFAAYQFLQIQPYWIPANLVAVPLTALMVLPLGLAALALMPLGLAALALVPMGWGLAVIVWMTAQIAAWPAAMLRVAPMSPAAPLLCAAGLIWLCIWRAPVRLAGLAMLAVGLAVAAGATPPDVLVSADARLIAIRDHDRVWLVMAPRAAPYTVAQWQTVWPRLPMIPAVCSAADCMIGNTWLVSATPQDCQPARLIVSTAAIATPCPARVLDRSDAFLNGATAAWFTKRGVRLWSDRAAEGDRPWSAPWPEE